MYAIEVAPAAERELGRLKGHIRKDDFDRLLDAISELATGPRPEGVRKIRGAEFAYRIRVGDYRIVYEIDDKGSRVLVLHVARRSESTYR